MEDKELVLQVYDTGLGLTVDELEELRKNIAAIKSGESGSFGMTYVIERLRLYANDNFDIEVDSKAGEFTLVTVRLNIREEWDV